MGSIAHKLTHHLPSRASIALLVNVATIGLGSANAAVTSADQVLSAWRERETRVSSFRFRCKQNETIVKGGMQALASLSQLPAGTLFPPKDVRTPARICLPIAAREDFSFQQGEHLVSRNEYYASEDSAWAYNGKYSTSLIPGLAPVRAIATVSDGPADRDFMAEVTFIPPLLLFRPFQFLWRRPQKEYQQRYAAKLPRSSERKRDNDACFHFGLQR